MVFCFPLPSFLAPIALSQGEPTLKNCAEHREDTSRDCQPPGPMRGQLYTGERPEPDPMAFQKNLYGSRLIMTAILYGHGPLSAHGCLKGGMKDSIHGEKHVKGHGSESGRV